jgi:hypothetical protein
MDPDIKTNISIDFIYLKGKSESVFMDFFKHKMFE